MIDMKQGARFLYRIFVKPLSTDEDQKRREYIFNIIVIGSIAMLLALDASVLYYQIAMGAAYRGISFWLFSLIPLFFIALYAASRRGFFVPASYLLVAAYFATNSYAAYRWGLALPTVLLGYALIIVIASILMNTKFGFLAAGITAAFIIPLWNLQLNGTITVQRPENPHQTDGFVFSLLYMLIAVVAWLSNREIERSLLRARKSESALKEERDRLEVTVQERTLELRKAEVEKMEQIYRFAEFGRLASGLFHDILNLLNAVSLRMKGDAGGAQEGSKTQESLAEALNTTKQIERFMHGIRRQLDHHALLESFSPLQSIDDVIQLLSYQARHEGIEVEVRADPLVPSMYFGNPAAFHHVMMNVILNAIESYATVPARASGQRKVTVILDESLSAFVISVRDHGCGIPENIREKIFEPFFSTKDMTKRLGIGLAMVKKIVEGDFHGTVSIESEEEKGTTFIMTLPFKIREAA